jgi:hypothetical protein
LSLIEPDAAVVLAGDQVVGVYRVVDLLLLGLAPIGAVLVDPLVAVARPAAAAERVGGTSSRRGLSGPGRAVEADIAGVASSAAASVELDRNGIVLVTVPPLAPVVVSFAGLSARPRRRARS